ncbi:UNVERIFIED_CONTAM: Transcription factor GTE4 [Sesamum calycinum]|uniref:Transcription factor GTE4 n=1 Tax=Sesamum calycinum TaxID=2727403 RepID=A0AAW2MCG5_9LAMI
MENNHRAGEFVEKEKRTPKANQYYRNSEFLLGKDRLPPESNKRLKTNNGRKYSGETEHAFGFGFRFEKSRNQVFKSCSSLLQRLMKHKYGWVFNEPVNAKALGLVDYHDIIKHPMDLGTIKTRLSQNWYKSPKDFAEDVRLVFHNAMTYNPKGQDVHIMAEQLLQIFEERWAIIETECNTYWKYQMYQDGGLSTPTSRKAPPQSHFTPASVPLSSPLVPGFISAATQFPGSAVPLYAPAAPQIRAYDRPEPMTSVAVDPKIHRPHVGRTPLPKKPKAKDPNKRDMTYEEKQRLSTNLQGLPSEKLDAIVQIIKKRNTALSQHDDEIEVDIDSVDPETLWELDRFVTNYKKSLSKNKRKAELALQARTVANQKVALTNSTPAVAQVQIESGAVPSSKAFERATAPPDEGKKQGYNGSQSSSSSSSSSDSGSSSSVCNLYSTAVTLWILRSMLVLVRPTFGYAEWPDGTGMPFDVLGASSQARGVGDFKKANGNWFVSSWHEFSL